jgi:peptidoglycan/LPS O-acetylase OafA/YrhL
MAVVASPYPVFHSLNLLRGLAALAVVLFHASPIFGRQMAPSGYLAVDLFFILSGFVIAHVYDPRFAAGLTARSFILARMARFWPLFALGTVIGTGWTLLENVVSPPAALSISETLGISALSLLYIPRITGADLFPLNVPAWSLFFELIVNAAFAIFFAASRTRWLLGVIAVAGAVVASLAIADRFDAQSWGGGDELALVLRLGCFCTGQAGPLQRCPAGSP